MEPVSTTLKAANRLAAALRTIFLYSWGVIVPVLCFIFTYFLSNAAASRTAHHGRTVLYLINLGLPALLCVLIFAAQYGRAKSRSVINLVIAFLLIHFVGVPLSIAIYFTDN